MTYEEAVELIINTPKFNTSDNSLRGKGGNANLIKVMDILGNPQDSLKAIHIAGTNGKGSTATFTASIMRNIYDKVAVFTSPHLVKINERMKINDDDISDEDFLSCYIRVKKAVEENVANGEIGLSFFEIVFAMACLYFKEQKVDVAIFETGLGGRLDATNIILPTVTAITSIGLDHTMYLGDTIEKVAYEKAGIIKDNVPIIYNTGEEKADLVIEEVATEKSAMMVNVAKTKYMINEFTFNGIDFSASNSYYSYRSLMIPSSNAYYQVDNAVTAINICNEFVNIKCAIKQPIEQSVIQKGLDMFFWPGRMEKIADNIILDGAHNLDAIERFVESVKALEGDNDIDLLFAVAGDKDYVPMIEYLVDNLKFKRIIVTTLNSNRKISSDLIRDIFLDKIKDDVKSEVVLSEEVTSEKTIEKAFDIAVNKAKSDGVRLYCVGSLYLIGDIKMLWRKRNDKL